MTRGVWRVAAGVLVAVALAGCGGGLPKTVKVGGTVTLDGTPLAEGTVLFYPADQDGAAPVAVKVVDGKYLAPAVPVGSYRVGFSSGGAPAGEPTGPIDSSYNAPSPSAGKPKPDPIPEKYRKPSLPADLTADNPALDFELKSK